MNDSDEEALEMLGLRTFDGQESCYSDDDPHVLARMDPDNEVCLKGRIPPLPEGATVVLKKDKYNGSVLKGFEIGFKASILGPDMRICM